MLDHHEARVWADHHHEFGAWVRGVPGAVRGAFEVLARIQYAAPWQAADAAADRAATAAPASRTDASARPCRA